MHIKYWRLISQTDLAGEQVVCFYNKSDVGNEIDRTALFRYAKFITQTYKYYQKICENQLDYELIKKVNLSRIQEHPFYKNSLEINKMINHDIIMQINGNEEINRNLASQLYILNSIYTLKYIDVIANLGSNGHEKAAFLYLAQRNYRDKIILNKVICKDSNKIVKEFDALIYKKQKSGLEVILVEEKTNLTSDSFQQIFGYGTKKRRMSHKDILINSELCREYDIPPVDAIEIIYSTLGAWFSSGCKLGRLIAEYSGTASLTIPLKKFIPLASEIVRKDALQDLQKKTQVREIIFTKLNYHKNNIIDKCLNPEIVAYYQAMLGHKL